MKSFLYTMLMMMVLLSCKSENDAQLDAKMAEFDQLTEKTIGIHDDLMEEMGTIMDLSMEIETRLQTADDEQDFMTERLVATRSSLDQAHDDMMDWMKNYSEAFPYDAESPATMLDLDDKMPVLESYYLDIKELQKETDRAIKDGQEVLDTTSY